MTRKTRIVSLLLAVCMLVSILPISHVTAATPASLTISELASAASSVAATLESSINGGFKDSNGVYTAFAIPETLTVGSYTLDTPSYTLMAARAVYALASGKSSSTAIPYETISYREEDVTCGNAATLNKGQYVDLAERVIIYAETGNGTLATSFNAPTDGYDFYNGRISIHSAAHIMTEALQAYASAGSLPENVTFLPTHFSNSVSGLSGWYAEVVKAAIYVEQYVAEKKGLPSSIPVGTYNCTYAQFTYVACQVILGINNGKTSEELSIPSYPEPANPSESLTAGTLQKAEILDLAQRSINFMINNGVAANYMITTLGNMHHYGAVHMYAMVLSYFAANGKLPDSIAVKTWFTTTGGVAGDATFGADYSAYAKYLVPTKNCQSNNATLIAVAKTGMLYSSNGYSSPTNTYQAMWNLEKYLNAKTSYLSYYDTERGALKTWNDKQGNCCDMAHLANACARALGVPGQYQHGYCRFSTFSTGHVWSRVYCGADRGWLIIDTVSNSNYLGYKSNTTIEFYNTYAELPF